MPEVSPDLWRRLMRQRLLVAALMCLGWAIAIEARLVYLQVYRHDEYVTRAENQQLRRVTLPAPRGEVLDRNGRVLAWSVPAESIYVVPNEIKEANRVRTIEALCGALGECDRAFRDGLLEKLQVRDAKGRLKLFAYVRRQVTPEQARRVVALDLEGVGTFQESRRFYPNASVGAHVIGYVNLDNKGLGGVELSYDKTISGTPGRALAQVDAHHHVFSRTEKAPAPGASIELTIDRTLQYIVERELKAGVAEHRAQGGAVIVMDPWTGDILAMANEPTFNPNASSLAEPVEFRNRAIEDTYEPGSTFKTVTASAALEEGVMHPDDLIDVSQGYILIGSRRVSDTHPNGVLSFTDVIVKSSNVGAIKVGFKLGRERLGRYVRRFGFGQRLLPDLRGESPGIVWREYTDSALASVSMGYQVGVTPLQMAAAVSSVANGGQLMEPHVVRAVQRGNERTAVLPRVLRRTITPETAATLTTIMEGVVERGTGKAAQIDGYTIAGKTGTAAKVVDGIYSKQKYNSSFVGFFPSRKPRFTIIVVIDSPSTGKYYGGLVAAPVFKRIAEATVPLLGVPRTVGAPATVLVKHEAESPARPASRTPRDILRTAGPGGVDVLPDVRGLSAREALKTLVGLGLRPRLAGDGIVIDQRPAAGTPLTDAAHCALRLALVVLEPAPPEGEAQP